MHELLGPTIQVLILLIGGTGLAGIIGAIAKRKETNSVAEVTLSASAMERMTAAEDRAERAETKADRLEIEMQKMRRKFFAYELWADQHQSWDQEAVTEVESLGGHLRPPPQLLIIKGASE